jgi:hypothetical protein
MQGTIRRPLLALKRFWRTKGAIKRERGENTMQIRNVSVDEIYEAMDKGERQHMANKLFKHGYESPKAYSNTEIEPFINRLHAKGEIRDLIEKLLEKYPATLIHIALVKSMREARIV